MSTTHRFTVQSQAPAITSLSVTSGPLSGGTSVLITGQNLQNVSQVMFGDVAAASFVVTGPNSVLAVAPSRAATGSVDITVTTPQGTSAATAVDLFTYVATTNNGGSTGGGSGTF